MDLIYTDCDGVEQGVVINYALDLKESTDMSECTFEVQTTIEDSVLDIGSYVYIEDSEIGGRVDSLKVDTASRVVYASGRTWRGVLGSKIIEPESGEAYYTATGTITDALEDLIEWIGLDELFEVGTMTDYNVNYQFNRYTDAYTGLMKLASKYGHKLVLIFNPSTDKVSITTKAISDYSNESEITSDFFNFKIERRTPECNHMIGLGSGELEERMVVHRYLHSDGQIYDTQEYSGADERVSVYDCSNAESEDELINGTIEALEKACVADSMAITAYDLAADLGDKFTAEDINTGISMTQYVISKIVTIKNDIIQYQYEVGDTI